MILLLSYPDDPMVELVARRLEARGARFFRFDEAQFPERARISARYSIGRGLTYELQVDGQSIDLGEIQTAWDHRPGPCEPSAALDPTARRFAARQSQQFLDDVWRTLECRWMPAHKDIVLRWQHKASQLALAQSLGFEIPHTLITNDPSELLEFHREQSGRIVSKVYHRNIQQPQMGEAQMGEAGGAGSEPCAYVCMTQIVSNRDLGYASSIRHAPVIFQSYVRKQIELRVTVVGQKVLTAAIHSQATHRTRHDWRHADLQHTRYTPYTLPAEIETRCLELVARMGLCFGTIDLVLTPEGRYVFLEINPSGQWRWVETMSGLPIADSIAELLAADVGQDGILRADGQSARAAVDNRRAGCQPAPQSCLAGTR